MPRIIKHVPAFSIRIYVWLGLLFSLLTFNESVQAAVITSTPFLNQIRIVAVIAAVLGSASAVLYFGERPFTSRTLGAFFMGVGLGIFCSRALMVYTPIQSDEQALGITFFLSAIGVFLLDLIVQIIRSQKLKDAILSTISGAGIIAGVKNFFMKGDSK